jgi:carbamoyltransferase
MGLAPFGNPSSQSMQRYKAAIVQELVQVYEDGSLWLNMNYFNFATGLNMIQFKKWERLFGTPARKPESQILQAHCDLSLAAQQVTEEIILKMALEAKRLTQAPTLCMAGGVALNCVANGRMRREKIFQEVFVPPAPGDAGGAVGAALAAYFLYFNQPVSPVNEGGKRAYLGPEYESATIQAVAQKYGASFTYEDNFAQLARQTAHLLAEGAVVGWFQGRMEFGPRALGNRSILADPRKLSARQHLNEKIKFRESFRPFAPAILKEYANIYFEDAAESPYMSFTSPVHQTKQISLPPDFAHWSITEKLRQPTSAVPAVTHLDFSARYQTVDEYTNSAFALLLRNFYDLTGCPILVNTSFNVRGEPIVCTPEDAYRCFVSTGMDYLVMGNFTFHRQQQPIVTAVVPTREKELD